MTKFQFQADCDDIAISYSARRAKHTKWCACCWLATECLISWHLLCIIVMCIALQSVPEWIHSMSAVARRDSMKKSTMRIWPTWSSTIFHSPCHKMTSEISSQPLATLRAASWSATRRQVTQATILSLMSQCFLSFVFDFFDGISLIFFYWRKVHDTCC